MIEVIRIIGISSLLFGIICFEISEFWSHNVGLLLKLFNIQLFVSIILGFIYQGLVK